MDTRNVRRSEHTSEQIRQAITAGDYLSGERLVELNLAKRYNVSQITIREALWLLEQQGWVIKKARRGVYVRSFSPEEAVELFNLLTAVEGLAFDAIAAQHGRRTALRTARLCLETAWRLSNQGDRAGAIRQLYDGHAELAQLANLSLTGQVLLWLINQSRLLEAIRQARLPGSMAEFNEYIEEHEALLDELEEGNAFEAKRLLREILDSYAPAVVAALKMQ